ncbi:MAG: MFS transporter [Prochloraceae cyanobacterium]
MFSLALISVFSTYVTQAIVDTIVFHFKISEQSASLAFTVASLGYSFALFFYSTLAKRIGFKNVLVLSIFLLSITAVVLSFIKEYPTFLSLRFFQGVFSAGIPAIGIAYIHTVFKRPQQVHGIFVSGLLSGALFSRVFGGIITHYFGISVLFSFIGLFSFVVGIFAYVLLKNDPPNGILENPFKIFSELKNFKIFYACLASFCFFGSFISIYNCISFFLVNTFSLNDAQIGLLFLFGFTGPITSFFSGTIFNQSTPLNWVFFCYAAANIALVFFSISTIYSVIAGLMLFNAAIFSIHAIMSSFTAYMAWEKSSATSLL